MTLKDKDAIKLAVINNYDQLVGNLIPDNPSKALEEYYEIINKANYYKFGACETVKILGDKELYLSLETRLEEMFAGFDDQLQKMIGD